MEHMDEFNTSHQQTSIGKLSNSLNLHNKIEGTGNEIDKNGQTQFLENAQCQSVQAKKRRDVSSHVHNMEVANSSNFAFGVEKTVSLPIEEGTAKGQITGIKKFTTMLKTNMALKVRITTMTRYKLARISYDQTKAQRKRTRSKFQQ